MTDSLLHASGLPAHVELPSEPRIEFPGFDEDAFRLLDRLRERPTILEYQKLKADLDASIMAPFKLYRDDLVVNFVLPNGLPLETERNVFSRFPKNDFGAGGAHSHLWFSFYRIGSKRLTDLQLVHSLSSDSFTVGLYLNRRMRGPWRAFRRLLNHDFDEVVRCFGRIASEKTFTLSSADSPALSCVNPDGVAGLLTEVRSGLWVRSVLPREEVLSLGPALSDFGISLTRSLWPAYHLILSK